MTYLDWRERFLEAVDESLYPAAWLDKRVADGRARFWGNARAAILAEIKQFPSGVKEVHGLVAAGSLPAIKALIKLAEEWGRQRGATIGSIQSRPEWAYAMADEGYQVEQVRIVKVL